MAHELDRDVKHSRTKQQRKNAKTSEAIEKASVYERETPPNIGSDDGLSKQAKEIESQLNELPDKEQSEIALSYLYQKYEYRSLIPPPDVFNNYTPEQQKKYNQWVDALILDESKRLDKAVDAGIRDGLLEIIVSFVVNAGSLGAALWTFLVTNDPASLGFFGLPVIYIVVNQWNDYVKRKSKKNNDSKSDE